MFLNRRNFIKSSIASTLLTYSGSFISQVHSQDNNILLNSLNVGLESDILLVIDVQNDFCPGGSLAVKNGNKIIKNINLIQTKFNNIALTQDWHPINHSSFITEYSDKEVFSSIDMPYGKQTIWPAHCIQGTKGADFHKDLNTQKANTIIRKGFRKEIDSYSAFWENDKVTPTGLEGAMKTMGVKRVFICGLALDFCVAYSAIDAAIAGFETYVIMNATKPVNLPGSVEAALKAFSNYNINKVDI